jgi:drug/metabolite transporter (DMT)-like permease
MLLALASSLLYGVSDFLGGVATRRSSTLYVTTITYLATTATLGLAALVVPGVWSAEAIRVGVLAGLAAVVGFVAFYAALAAGPISLLAPGIALVQSVVPVCVGVFFLGERLQLPGWLGIAAGLAAGVLLGVPTGGPVGRASRRAVFLAVVAGLALGLSVVGIDAAPSDAGMVPVLVEAAVGLVLLGGVFVARRAAWRGAPSGVVTLAFAAGVLLGGGNALLMAALYREALSVVAVLVGLYPLGTVLLARLVLRERLSTPQLAGVGLAVLGSVLLGLA